MAKNEAKEITDKELWDQLQAGQPEAVSVLYRRHYRGLYNYGIKISRDESLTKDCIQEIFVALWEKRASLSAVSQVKPYLLTYLRRQIFHSLQQATNHSAHEWNSLDHFEVELSHESMLILDQITLEMKTKLNDALQKLTPRQREVIYLRFFDALSCEAISEIMSLRYQSVINLMHDAIKKLRENVNFLFQIVL